MTKEIDKLWGGLNGSDNLEWVSEDGLSIIYLFIELLFNQEVPWDQNLFYKCEGTVADAYFSSDGSRVNRPWLGWLMKLAGFYTYINEGKLY